MKKLLFVFFTLMTLGSIAQSVNGLTAPHWFCLTDPASQRVSVFAPLNNIGALGECRSSSAAVSAERRILGVDLQYVYGSICLPLASAGLGISVTYGALDLWRQSKLGLAYGRKLAAGFSLAIQVNYHRVSVGGYGAAGTITPAIGMVYHLTEKTVVNVFADNPYGGRLGSSKEKVGSMFTAMVSNDISGKLVLALKVSREQFAPADIFFLLNYGMHPKFQLDGGISLNRANGFVGSSLLFRQIRLRQIICWSQAQGFGSAIVFEFRKPVKDE
jgi:hypothetical protein